MKNDNDKQNRKLLIMAGGTGGHVFPGLAVAQLLRAEGWDIQWLGTADRMEADLVPQYGIPIDFIQISGVRGKGLKAIISAPFAILRAVFQAKRLIKKIKPDVVLGMGGYVSGPGGLAAKWANVPMIIHEQNGIAGFTNRWLAKLATKSLQAFPGALAHGVVVGNPIRSDIARVVDPIQRFNHRQGAIRVLVIGGSQGASILNRVVPEVVNQLSGQVIVWHQTGKGAKEVVVNHYDQAILSQSRITEFIDDMAEAYAWADVIVCRSGALTVSEIAAVGLAAIFVPFMHRDRQQYLNAERLAKCGAAVIVEQADFTAKRVVKLFLSWNRSTLLNMAIRARKLGITDAAERVALVVKQMVK